MALRRGPRPPTGRSLRSKLDTIARRHGELRDQPDQAEEHAAFALYLWVGLRLATVSEPAWRRAATRAASVCAMRATLPRSPEAGDEPYPGERSDAIVTATLRPLDRRRLDKLPRERFWKEWHQLRLDLVDRLAERAAALLEADPRLDLVNLLDRALGELEAETGVSRPGPFDATMRPPIRERERAPEPRHRPAGW